MKAYIFIPLLYPLIFISHNIFSQNNLLDSLLQTLPNTYAHIIQSPDKFRFQLIYTSIRYNEKGEGMFKDYYFNYSDTVYNYPASMVKFPASIIAVKKIETLNKDNLSLDSKIIMDSLFCQKSLLSDTVGFPKYPHLRKWIKRMLIISDNEAYTHTYDFINCKTMHSWLKEWGFYNARIINKFIPKCINDSTYYTPTVYVLDNNNDTIFIQYQDSICKFNTSEKNYTVGYVVKKIKKKRKIIRRKIPKSFVKHNDWPLNYSHQLMKYFIFDQQLKKLSLNNSHYDSLLKYMGSYPREYSDLNIDSTAYYDTWKKFFIYGGKYKRIQDDTLRSINIIGRAYGFLSETAYIVDFKNNVDFILSASIYVNPNNIMDNKYNYELAYQLFYDISKIIYKYEKENNIKHIEKSQYYENLFKKK